MIDYQELIKYAKTNRQIEILQMLANGENQSSLARRLNISRNTVKEIVARVRAHANVAQLHSVSHKPNIAPAVLDKKVEISPILPDGYTIKGVSTYYNEEGKATGSWVRSGADSQRQVEMMKEAIQAMCDQIPPVVPTAWKGPSNKDLLSLYTITDYHLGMFAHADESGKNWNTKKAIKTFQKTIKTMMDTSPKSDHAVLNIQGDFMHSDGLEAVTPSRKHVLDQDVRYHVLMGEAVKLIRSAVTLLLTKHKKTTLLIAQGNHDLSGSLWLQTLFNTLYREEKRINVIVSGNPYYCLTHGKTMLAFHHGHKADVNKFGNLIPAMFAKEWGETRYRYGHIGHRHHALIKENHGIIIEQHQTLSPKDAYAAHGGYIAERSAKLTVYSKSKGEYMNIKIRP